MDARTTIIGAGVVGLAIAAELGNNNVFVLEKNPKFGQETSSRNSEVIHAGLYYKPDSFKAQFSIEGNALLYEICQRHNISHKKLGKLIVANTEEEEQVLEELLVNAKESGVDSLSLLNRSNIRDIEPNIMAKSALFSPSTGILDSHELMRYYLTKASSKGVNVVFNTNLIAIEFLGDGYLLTLDTPEGEYQLTSETIINSAGLNSDVVAAMLFDAETLSYYKGDYFSVSPSKSKLVSRLIYPVPLRSGSGLGIHVTLDLDGQMRLGPDSGYVDREGFSYPVDISKKLLFYESAKVFLPFLELDDLQPAFSGIRPKINSKEPFCDFVIREETARGYPGLVNLIGIESPGLTASLAIAKYVKELIK